MYKAQSAVYALNSYTWKLLEANLGWERWKGVPPIIPTQQHPEFLQSGKAFIVYGAALHPAMDVYELHKESVSYNIYATSSTEANNVASLLYDVFKRQDEAAADVNEWLNVEATGERGSRDVSFGSVRAVMVEKAEPADEEGGYVSALVMIETKYTTGDNEIQTSGFTV